ncbi:hypothetical protein F4804DRAFT_312677 [Jackrogersella minutella]|nr:hypothetical protein F4804DRAFT_312677 [Jackrogersella minutella]
MEDQPRPSVPKAKKVGRKYKDLEKRVITRVTPYGSNRPRCTNKKKKEVLTWLAQSRIPLRQSIAVAGFARPNREIEADEFEPLEPGFRRPSFVEAAAFFKLNNMTVGTWWHRRHDILEGNYNKNNIIKPEWPELEERLYVAFLDRRSQHKAATRAWFKVNSTRIFNELYPSGLNQVFIFSAGWFTIVLSFLRIEFEFFLLFPDLFCAV